MLIPKILRADLQQGWDGPCLVTALGWDFTDFCGFSERMKTCRDSRAAGKSLWLLNRALWAGEQEGSGLAPQQWPQAGPSSGVSSGTQVAAQELSESHKANIFPFDFHPEKISS